MLAEYEHTQLNNFNLFYQPISHLIDYPNKK